MQFSKRGESTDSVHHGMVNNKHDILTQPTNQCEQQGSVSVEMGGSDKQSGPDRSKPGPDSSQMEFKILCLDLNKLPAWAQFLTCCGGVFFFYLIYGYFQELIFHLEGFKPFGWFLTLIQFACYALFSFGEQRMKPDQERKIPLRMYALIALLTVATMGLSNSSLGYLNYPTQVIFKSCKLIPVLLGGVIIQQKRYGVVDVLACLCMSVGLIFFTLADSSVSPTFSLYGVLLISLALCADAIIGNVQEKVMVQYSSSNTEMVMTTCRKSLTIIFSFLLFAKPFTMQYVWSGIIVLLGIYLNIYSKNQAAWNAKVRALLQGHIITRKVIVSPEQMV